MLDNYLSKSIRSVVGDMVVSGFLIRQVGHEDIWYYLTRWKGQILSQAMKDERKDGAAKLFNKVQHFLWPTCFVFSQMRKFSARIRWWTHRTTVGFIYPHKMYRYQWKPNTQSRSRCLEWSLAILCFSISSHIATDSIETHTAQRI